MYSLFNEEDRLHLPRELFPAFDYVRRTYINEVLNIVDYYRNRVYAVKSNHFLANLLYHINIPMQYSIDRYTDVAYARAPFLAKTLNMTSDINYGQIFKGVFYGLSCDELILYEEEYFNPFYAEREWERINAVKVLLHPKSDLGLLLPNGRDSSTGGGLAVIAVNVPLLAVQYRGFVKNQMTKIKQEDNAMLGIQHFIHMYVLPNMLYSQIDITIMNRLMNLFYNAPMSEPLLKHPFKVLDLSHRVDHVLMDVLKVLQNKPERFDAAMNQVPTIIAKNMQDALQMPDIAPTRQVMWALLLTRLDIMKFFIDVSNETSLRINRMEINQLKRLINHMRIDAVFSNVLPKDLTYDTMETIDAITAL
mgnify:CR=1 FL=1